MNETKKDNFIILKQIYICMYLLLIFHFATKKYSKTSEVWLHSFILKYMN